MMCILSPSMGSYNILHNISIISHDTKIFLIDQQFYVNIVVGEILRLTLKVVKYIIYFLAKLKNITSKTWTIKNNIMFIF